MPTYQETEEIFSTALESMLSQTYKNITIFLILDDPHNTKLNKLSEQYSKIDKRIKVIKNSSNMGLTSSLNKAIDLVEGPFICRMDADDISEPFRISDQLFFLIENDLDLVGGFVNVIDEDNNSLYKITNIPTDFHSTAKALRWNNVVPHPCWLGKTEIFRNKYRSVPFCEDYDFLVRTVINGYRIGNLNKVILNYRITNSSISRSHLLEQFLTSTVISDKYKNNQFASIDEIESYVKERATPINQKKYSKAYNLFNRALRDYENKKYLNAIAAFSRSITTSCYFRKKAFKMCLASLFK